MRRFLLPGCVLLASATTHGLAFGQGMSDQMLAQSLFDEGRQLMAQKRYAEACPKLAESQRLDPGGGTLTNLAICHEGEGKTGSAYLEFMAASSQAAKDGRADREKIAKDHLAQLGPRVPKLKVHVEHASAGTEIAFDGTTLREPAWDVPFVVDPGRHVLTASVGGRLATRIEIRVAEGEQRVVSIDPASANVASDEPAPSTVPRKETNPWFVGSVVVTTVGFTVAIPSAYVWFTLKTSESTCSLTGNDGTFCTSSSTRGAWLSAAIGGAVVGVVGLAGVVLFPNKIAVAPTVSSNGGGFAMGGTF